MIYSIPYLRIRNTQTLALYFRLAYFPRLPLNLFRMNLKRQAERFALCRRNIHWDEVALALPDNDIYNRWGHISL